MSYSTSPLDFIKQTNLTNPLFAEIKYEDQSLNTNDLVDTDVLSDGDHFLTKKEWQMADISKPLLGDCEIKFLSLDNLDQVDIDTKKNLQSSFWHSSAHILGYAIEQNFQDSLLTVGPPIKDGFFYDFQTERPVTEEDYQAIEKSISKIIGQKFRFERLILSKEEALDLFQYNKFKTYLIQNKVPDNALTSAYKIGDFIDLCTGPHILNTGQAKAFAIMKHSSAYWLGNQQNESLQRVYGISFTNSEKLQAYQKQREEAIKRDHRTVGQNQDLFFFSKYAPGSAFFLNHGTKIYNKLVDLMKSEYKKRGYQEVITPNLFHIDLWKVSGHYKNYKENLFLIQTQDHGHAADSGHHHSPETFGLKPMNCPGHCLIFKHHTHSYKELPMRVADFGVLHRNEISGALSGLTRVRRFQQDDAHIFCRKDQIEQEVLSCLQFLDHIYGLFGFKWDILLSTRPEASMGSDELWQEAESQLISALEKCNKKWTLNQGDGAFYGPKIDIILYDALGRAIQCGTIQLDFQLPIRFNLQYTGQNKAEKDNENQEDNESQNQLTTEIFEPDEFSSTKFEWKEQPLKRGNERPVIIHRAILGSVERFIAILTEHLAGKWPIWLSPRQIAVCSLSAKHLEYSKKVFDKLKRQGYEVELDDSNVSINKKIRNAQLNQFNLILILGEKEEESQTVEIRTREGQQLGKMSLDELIQYINSQYPEGIPLPNKLQNDNRQRQ